MLSLELHVRVVKFISAYITTLKGAYGFAIKRVRFKYHHKAPKIMSQYAIMLLW